MKMKIDSIDVVTYSPTHTSQKIALNVAGGFLQTFFTDEKSDVPVEEYSMASYRFSSGGAKGNGLPAADSNTLSIVAAPVYGGRLAEVAVERFRRLEGCGAPAVAVVLYGNRDYEDALVELADLLEEQGFSVVAAGAFIGEHSYSRKGMPIAEGRPDRKDCDKAWNFGRDIAVKLMGAEEDTESLSVRETIKGNRPYKAKAPSTPKAPECNDDLCIRCGRCESVCPVGAIELGAEGIVTDSSLCTKCCACFKYCPVGALTFDTPYTERLFKNCSARREPEIFI